jgi:predicted CXXCH cytochrome family protein
MISCARFVPVVALLLPLAVAAQESVRSGGDIRATRHNLTGQPKVADSRDLCVFCHTPSLSEQGEGPSAAGGGAPAVLPRWQRGLPQADAAFEYSIYDDIGGGRGVGSQSVLCLSCHDAAQAFGIAGGGGDHPIGIPYRGSLVHPSLKAANETPEEQVVRRARHGAFAEDDFRPPRQAVINDREVWWVPTSEAGVARTRQDLPLYIRERGNALDDRIPHLECSSCHDPHSGNRLFLRVVGDGSRLCLACHEK